MHFKLESAKFNKKAKSEKKDEIDKQIVNLRNALAHGRTFSLCNKYPLRLIKFSNPKDNYAEIVYSEEMTEEWFDSQIKLVHEAIVVVGKATPECEIVQPNVVVGNATPWPGI